MWSWPDISNMDFGVHKVEQWNLSQIQWPEDKRKLSRREAQDLAWKMLREPLDPRNAWMSVAEIRKVWQAYNERKWVGNDWFDKRLDQTGPWYYDKMMKRRHPDIFLDN